MKADVRPAADPAQRLPHLRRFSRAISRLGALRATLLLSLISSIGSLGFTWLIVSVSSVHTMGNAFWISLLAPFPLTMVFGRLCMFLVVSLDQAWSQVHALAMQDALTDLLARWGGEEFIMLLPYTALVQARQLAERVRESILARPSIRVVDGRPITVSASLGAAGVTPGQMSSLEQLIRRADTAWYMAKSAGRGRVSMSEPDHPRLDGLHLPATPV